MGGAGSAVCEFLNSAQVLMPVLQIGLPDEFIDHGEQGLLRTQAGLDAAGIRASIEHRFGGMFVAENVA
jgi:1-deoxy-D-xylulose-5-phosphate synthase